MINSSSAGVGSQASILASADEWLEELNSQQDRERIIELLLS